MACEETPCKRRQRVCSLSVIGSADSPGAGVRGCAIHRMLTSSLLPVLSGLQPAAGQGSHKTPRV